jgi:hypothetical protein
MLHIRGEHDVVDYIVRSLRRYPMVVEALEHDSYIYRGHSLVDGYRVYGMTVLTLRGKARYHIELVVGKPPIKPYIKIKKVEVQDADAATKYSPANDAATPAG